MKRGWWILKGIVFVALMVLIFGVTTRSLWNWIVPALFNGPVITFAQAIGLLLLIKILLFWSVGKGGGHVGHWRGSPWKSHLREKWGTMTPEEREKLKEKIRGKWCGPKADESGPSANV
jgi:hypothetical protein